MQQEIKAVDNGFSAFADRPLVMGDKNAYFVSYDITEAESYLMVTAKRSDGRVIKCFGEPVKSGKAICVLESNMYAMQGDLILRLTVFSGNESLTVREIRTEVIEALE